MNKFISLTLLTSVVAICCFTPSSQAKPITPGPNEAVQAYKTAVRVHKWASQKERFNLYAKSAQLGHPIAQFNLAMMYFNGKSVVIDHQQAVYWFKKSAAQKFSTAQYRLGEMYYFAKGGLIKNTGKAIELFRLAAAQNEAGAQLNLAILYGSGDGVILNFAQANHWFNKAMKQAEKEATAYQNLLFMDKNKRFSTIQTHFYWTQKAAALGIAEAKIELSKLYKTGRSVLFEDDNELPVIKGLENSVTN